MFALMRRLFRHSVVYGMAETISRGTGFVLVYIYVRILTKSEIGVRSALYFASALITLFYTLGLDHAFLRYFMDEEYDDKKSTLFSTALTFTVLTGSIFFLCALFFSDFFSTIITKSDSYTYITILLFIILILDTVVIYPSLILRAENRFQYYLFISCTRFILFIVLNLALVWYFDRGVNGVFEANLLVVGIVFLLFLPVYRNYFSLRISLPFLKRMLLFGIPTIFTVLAMRIIDFSDRRIIIHFLGEESAGEYSVAYSLGMVGIMVFVNSFRTAWQPFFLSIKTNPEAKDVFSRVATYYSMFIGMVFLGMVLFREEIFKIYANPEYQVSLSAIIPYVAFSYILYGIYIIMLPGVFFREKTIYLPLAAIAGAVVNVGLNIFFIPRFGIIGAAYSTVAAYVIMVAILYFVSRYIYMVRYELGRLSLVVLFTAVPVIITLIYQPYDLIARIFFNIALWILPPAAYYFSGFLKQDEREIISQVAKRFISE